MNNLKVIHFLSFNDPSYSRSGTFLTNGMLEILDFQFHRIPRGIRESLGTIRAIRNTIEKDPNLVVLSGSSVITIYLRIVGFRRKNILLDLGWTSFEATLFRKLGKNKIWRLLRTYLLDFLSLHSSKHIFVESTAQKDFISRIFFFKKNQISVIPTGVNESAFNNVMIETGDIENMRSDFYLFRGKNVLESGLDNLSKASWLLPEDIQMIIITDKLGELKFNPKNTTVLEGFQEISVVKFAYSHCLAVLGQLSNSKRLKRTIPHKAFEAAFFGKAYVTVESCGVIELFGKENLCIIDSPQAESISQNLITLAERFEYLNQKGKKLNKVYEEKFSQSKLQQEFLRGIFKL